MSDPPEVCKIPLRNLKGEVLAYALVSPEDFERVNAYCWHRHPWPNDKGFYANGGPGNSTAMHNFVMGTPEEEFIWDHIDHCGLNNLRANLRKTDRSGNGQNKEKREGCSSQYINVNYNSVVKKFAVIVKKANYGLFEDEEEAGKVADKAIIKTFGKDAKTNGLLSAEEVQEVLCGDAPKPVRKASGLPTGVTYRPENDKYRATLIFDAVTYPVGTFVFWEQAEEAYNDKLSELKAAKWREHKKKPITRNAKDVAVVEVKNKKKEVVGQALVDDNKWHELTQHSWNMSCGHPVATINRELVKMHRYLLPGAKQVRHINGNRLDERLANLTSSTSSSINQNHASKQGGSSRFRGISWNKKAQKWEGEIRKDKARYKLGYFDDEKDAAKAYNKKALELFDKPYLNQVD